MDTLEASLVIMSAVNYVESDAGIAIRKALKGNFDVRLLAEEEQRLCLAILQLKKLL